MKTNIVQVTLTLPFSFRQQRLARKRRPMDESEFVQSIASDGGDDEAARLLYRALLDWVYVDGFSPRPADKLSVVYGIAEEELDEDLIRNIFQQLELNLPKFETIKEFGKIDTPVQIAQLIRYVRLNGEQPKPPSPSY